MWFNRLECLLYKPFSFYFAVYVSFASLGPILDGYELYGLEMITALKGGSGGKLQLGYGTLYPTLRRLEKKGFVQSRWGEETPEDRRGARRRYYKVTSKRAKLLQELQQLRAGLVAWKLAAST